jgi:BNR repeat protein
MISLVLLALVAQAPIVTGWPGRQPQLAGDGQRAFLTFVRDGAIVVLRSADYGRTFDEVSSIRPAGTIAVGNHRGPRIAVTDRVVVVTAIVGEQGGGKDGDVIAYRSTDEGRNWSPAMVLNAVPDSAREGLHGVAANAGGVVTAAWLDLRQTGTRVFAAVSRDAGATWSHDVAVYASPSGSVCECCHTSVVVSAQGRIGVMFRNQVEGYRDMYLAWSRDGYSFGPAAKLGEGTWSLQACPMDGGGLAMAGSDAITAWRREDGIFLAAPSAPERRIGEGRDPAVAVSGGQVDVAWSAAGLVTLGRGQQKTTIGPGRFPTLLADGDHTLLAWEHDGRVEVRRVDRETVAPGPSATDVPIARP